MVNKKDKLEDRRDQEKDVTTLQNHLSHQMVNHQKKKTNLIGYLTISDTHEFLFAYLNFIRHGQNISWLSNQLLPGHFKQALIKDTYMHIMKCCLDNN